MRNPLTRFIVAVLAWLPVTFAIWYFTAPLLTVPMHWLALATSKLAFADLFVDVEKNGVVRMDIQIHRDMVLHRQGYQGQEASINATHLRRGMREIRLGEGGILSAVVRRLDGKHAVMTVALFTRRGLTLACMSNVMPSGTRGPIISRMATTRLRSGSSSLCTHIEP